MTADLAHQPLALYGFFITMLFIAGLYGMLVSRNLIRILINLEILTKAVTLLIIVVGNITGRIAQAQALAITLIIIEVVVIAIAAGIILCIFRNNETLDARIIQKLKG